MPWASRPETTDPSGRADEDEREWVMSHRGTAWIVSAFGLAVFIGGLQTARGEVPPWLAVPVLIVSLALAAYGAWLMAMEARSRSPERGGAEMYEGGSGWRDIGNTGRFRVTEFPMSVEAARLSEGRHIVLGEFDTKLEEDHWRRFLYDPLSVLLAEGILDEVGGTRRRIHIGIYKLSVGDREPEGPLFEEYRAAKEPVMERSAEEYGKDEHMARLTPDFREGFCITTTVINHEQPLNFRIGMATIQL
jgi:hypothetical protein